MRLQGTAIIVVAGVILPLLGMAGRDAVLPSAREAWHPVTPEPLTPRPAPGQTQGQPIGPASKAAVAVPATDVRLRPDFLADLIAHKKNFRLPDWAQPGRARQVRFDGGPMFAACQFESGWKYLTDPETPGFTGMIKSVWTLTNLYTDDIERRLDEIRAAGYNWVWVSYQLGYAFEDEARQRAQVRRLIRLAHARGIRVTAYFSLTSIFTTSSYTSMPESKGWVQEHADGTPIAYSGIPHRLMACVNKPGRLAYLKKVAALAVEDGADDIFYDSIFNRCYCAECDAGFREYTRRVLGTAYPIPKPAQVKKTSQFDIDENYDFAGLNSSAMEVLFTEYSHYASAKAIAELDRHAKSINPVVLTSANTHRFRYTDAVVDLTWNEDGNGRGGRIDEKGRLTTPLGIYAWGQAVSNERKNAQYTVAPHEYWQIQPPEYYKQTIADAASFGVNFTMLASYAFGVRFDDDDPIARRAWGGISTGLNFVARHPALFEGARPIADVAVYYSHPSRIRPNVTAQGGVDWSDVVQNLFLAGIPARVVTDEESLRIGAAALRAKTSLIVLPGVACLSDEEIALLNDYAQLGGKLLVTEDAGTCTGFWTPRTVAPWASAARTATAKASVAIASRDDLATPARVAATIQSFLGRAPMIAIAGNGRQFVNPTLAGRRVVLHVINYDRARQFDDLRVTLAVGAWRKDVAPLLAGARTATWISPDTQGRHDVALTWKGDTAELTIPRLDVSGLLIIGDGL